jgi:L-threonylcarbamoyladenylate synthase
MPGPLTIVGARTAVASDSVTGGQDTVAVRVPSHPVAHDLLARLRARGVAGLVAPSANTFGHVSPTTAAHVERDLGEYLRSHGGLILDGGPCAVGVESTIVLATGDSPVLLRPGAVSREMITAVTGLDVAAPGQSAPRVSGSLDSHYAPRAQVHVHTPAGIARASGITGGLLAVADVPDLPGLTRIAAPRDADELARELYAALRRADDLGLADIHVVVPDADSGVLEALRDRVSRASAPR